MTTTIVGPDDCTVHAVVVGDLCSACLAYVPDPARRAAVVAANDHAANCGCALCHSDRLGAWTR